MSDSVRINRWLSMMGVCSRKQADRLIKNGVISVNNTPANLGMKINQKDLVKVAGKVIDERPKAIFMLYHKPIGIVCTHAPEVKNGLHQVLQSQLEQRVFAIGRLDKDSEGLLLLTNQGDVVNQMMQAEHKQEKEYIVTVDKNITDDFIKAMSEGVEIFGGKTLPCKVEKLSDREFRIILVQGLNLQIRRMCKALGYRVKALKRVRIMNLELGKLKSGEIRFLTTEETSGLMLKLKLIES